MLDKDFIKVKIELIQRDLERLQDLRDYTGYCKYILNYVEFK